MKEITKIAAEVKIRLRNAESGHDWHHTQRVRQNAKLIAVDEDVDLVVIELAALLHDIADAKFNDGDEAIGPKVADQILDNNGIPLSIRDHVVKIINHVSFKNSLQGEKWSSNFMISFLEQFYSEIGATPDWHIM